MTFCLGSMLFHTCTLVQMKPILFLITQLDLALILRTVSTNGGMQALEGP